MKHNLKAPQRVVITGAGNISPLGNSWDEVKASFLSQKNAIRYMHEWDQYPDLRTRLGAPVDNFELPKHYRAKQKRSMGRVAQMAVLATERALDQAGLLEDPIIKSGDMGVSYGSATGSSKAGMEFFKLLDGQSIEDITTTTYIRLMSHTAAVNIGVYFGTQGRMYTTSSACTAGSQGIGYAYEAIRAGTQKLMIAGGAEELCVTQAAVFDTIFAASLKNDATILAEIIGFGTNTDGGHIVRPRQATMQRVMELAMEDSGISSDEIGFVSAHATATDQGDVFESHATFDVVGKKPINSIKSYTGHGLGACGSFELWSSINMMQEGWIAPTLNLHEVDERCADLDYIKDEPREIKTKVFMTNNFAFGGINTSLIVRSGSAI